MRLNRHRSIDRFRQWSWWRISFSIPSSIFHFSRQNMTLGSFNRIHHISFALSRVCTKEENTAVTIY